MQKFFLAVAAALALASAPAQAVPAPQQGTTVGKTIEPFCIIKCRWDV